MAGAHRPDVTAIPLGRPSPGASSNQPERRGQRIRPCCASGAACRSYSVLLPAGLAMPPTLPPARCALTAPFHPYLPLPGSFGGRFAFCCTVPGVAPAGNYPAPCFHGARTFLPALIRNAGRAAIRPADGANKGRSACYVKELLAGHCGARERATMPRPSICKHGQARNLGEAATLALDQRTAETHVAEGVEQRAAPIKSSIHAPLRPGTVPACNGILIG